MAKKLISKIIHTCWFGSNQKPPKILACLESWKKHLPEYEIREWNEHNFDLSQNPFALEAFNRKRYAFVTDYCRLKLLYDFGGLYFDSDIEIVKPLDKFLWNRAFSGHETDSLTITAVMGAEKNHPWVKMLLDYYSIDRPYSERTNTQIITELNKPWIERQSYGHTYLKEGVVIFPVSTFASFDHINLKKIPSDDAYAYHLYAGSWTSRGEK